jgi:hypothetical protein
MNIAKLKVYSARLVLRRKYGKPVIQRINAHAYRGWSAKLSKNFHVINMGMRVEYYPRDGVNPFHNLYRITAIPRHAGLCDPCHEIGFRFDPS